MTEDEGRTTKDEGWMTEDGGRIKALAVSAIGNRLHDYPKPAYAGSRKADEGFAVSAQPNGRLWVFVAANLFGNILIPEFFP